MRLEVMLKRSLIKTSWCEFQKRYIQRNSQLSTRKHEEHELTKIRNIGILAHIDAGKTTTTERMLYYSGLIRSMGEVHHGNTVTDYMEQERQRGITITSAAVTFDWKNHRINLIDTPGHIDFTMEVEQTLRVLDGAVVILDGSAGVEAQTLTVCRQADKYKIPRIIYVNKMDRSDANFDTSIRSVETKLDVETLAMQFPIKHKGILEGIVDIVSLEKLIFDKNKMGMNIARLNLTESEDKSLWETANEKRRKLIDTLSSMDDKLADLIIEQESLDNISPQTLVDSVRRVTINRKAVPVLLGSSYKNIGVQPLMDSVLLYLPSPGGSEAAKHYRCFEDNLSARVFKIVHDKQRGPITFCRIYTGTMKKGERMYNIQRERAEQSGRLYIACADDYEEIPEISGGNIVAITGLKSTVTGDLLTTSASVAARARKNLQTRKDFLPEDIDNFFAPSSRLLEPVFFCSIEPPSLSTQTALENALLELEREDPSLRVTQNMETGQTELGGMGELHIEIIKERIRSEYKIDVDLGQLQIAYRETINKDVKNTLVSEHKIGTTNHRVAVTLSLISEYKGKEQLLLDRSPDHAADISSIHPKTMQAVKTGVRSALLHGPKLSYPVINVAVKLHCLELGRGTSSTMVSAAVSQCVQKLLHEGEITLLEPIMRLEVVASEEYASGILTDLMKRRSEILHVGVRGHNKVVDTLVPLSELLGYSTTLRIITSGHSTFTMEFDHYRKMDAINEAEAIKRASGF